MQHAALRAAFGFVGLLWVNAVFFGHLGFLKTAAARGKCFGVTYFLVRGDPSSFEYDRITRNKVFRFYSMFIKKFLKWYSVSYQMFIQCLFINGI